jgi:hypothetical protein
MHFTVLRDGTTVAEKTSVQRTLTGQGRAFMRHLHESMQTLPDVVCVTRDGAAGFNIMELQSAAGISSYRASVARASTRRRSTRQPRRWRGRSARRVRRSCASRPIVRQTSTARPWPGPLAEVYQGTDVAMPPRDATTRRQSSRLTGGGLRVGSFASGLPSRGERRGHVQQAHDQAEDAHDGEQHHQHNRPGVLLRGAAHPGPRSHSHSALRSACDHDRHLQHAATIVLPVRIIIAPGATRAARGPPRRR